MIELNDTELELVAGGVTVMGGDAHNFTAASGPDAMSSATGLTSTSTGSGGTVGIGKLIGPVTLTTLDLAALIRYFF